MPADAPSGRQTRRGRAALWRSAPGLLAGAVLAFSALQTAGILLTGDGAFTYTLDDPYIHLALSEQIRHLHYGINPAETATPSSSVLWPFALAVTAGTPLHSATPLLIDLGCTLLTGWLLLHLLDLVTDGAAGRRPALSATIAGAVLLVLNWAGVAFTGMEHSAHVAATLAVSVGLVHVAVRHRVPWWLTTGLVLGPSLRYEGLAVTVAGAAVLFWWGHRRTAVLSCVLAVLPLAAFSLFAVARGLSPLPSSVLVKSAVADGGGSAVRGAAAAVASAVGHPLFAVLVAGLLAHLLVRRRVTALHLFALGVLAAHAVGGQFGWFSRYELYVYAAVLPVVAYLARQPLLALYETRRPARLVVAGLLVACTVTQPYLVSTAQIPLASANIHTQQAQMARFVDDHWHRPVAVNDIGLVAYRGGEYTLDLWGLADQTARVARSTEHGTAWMERLVREHHVGLAMLYHDPDWFPDVPRSWQRVGVLSCDLPLVTAAEDTVTFYATSADQVAPAARALEEFRQGMPAHAGLRIDPVPR